MYIDLADAHVRPARQVFRRQPQTGHRNSRPESARVCAYKPSDRKGIREAFRAAIEAGGDNTDPETVVAYFSNLCDDYRNTDEVMPDEIIAEYDRLTPFFEKNPAAAEYKSQFDAAFGLSGAASCENLERLFKRQARSRSRRRGAAFAGRGSDVASAGVRRRLYFTLAEKYYQVKPSSETAMFLAQAFQNKKDYAKAKTYLNEALDVEKDPAERQKLLVRIALVGLVSNDIPGAAAAARQARDLDPEDGVLCQRAGAVLCHFGRQLRWFRWSGDLLGRLTIRCRRPLNCSRRIRSTWNPPKRR